MDLARVLRQLHEELKNLNLAIASLERLEEAGKSRTSDPEWLKSVAGAAPRKRNKSKSGNSGQTTSTESELSTESPE